MKAQQTANRCDVHLKSICKSLISVYMFIIQPEVFNGIEILKKVT